MEPRAVSVLLMQTQLYVIHSRCHKLLTVFYLYSECLLRSKCNYNAEIKVNNKDYIKASMSGVFHFYILEFFSQNKN